MHMKEKTKLEEGDPVTKGQIVGYVGNTDGSKDGGAIHLHFEASNNGDVWGLPLPLGVTVNDPSNNLKRWYRITVTAQSTAAYHPTR